MELHLLRRSILRGFGTTDTVDHVAAISDGKVFGQYDVTAEEFDVYEVWEGTRQIAQNLEAINAKDFTAGES